MSKYDIVILLENLNAENENDAIEKLSGIVNRLDPQVCGKEIKTMIVCKDEGDS